MKRANHKEELDFTREERQKELPGREYVREHRRHRAVCMSVTILSFLASLYPVFIMDRWPGSRETALLLGAIPLTMAAIAGYFYQNCLKRLRRSMDEMSNPAVIRSIYEQVAGQTRTTEKRFIWLDCAECLARKGDYREAWNCMTAREEYLEELTGKKRLRYLELKKELEARSGRWEAEPFNPFTGENALCP